MPYGLSEIAWSRLSPDDQAALSGAAASVAYAADNATAAAVTAAAVAQATEAAPPNVTSAGLEAHLAPADVAAITGVPPSVAYASENAVAQAAAAILTAAQPDAPGADLADLEGDTDPDFEAGPLPTAEEWQAFEEAAAAYDDDEEAAFRLFAAPRFTVVGAPGCGSHSPPASCRYHALSVAHGCPPGDAPCNWQSTNAYDVIMPIGTPVVPCRAGTVGTPPRWGYGLMESGGGRFAGSRLHVVHDNGMVSFYTHLRELVAKPGDRVSVNSILGYSGVANGLPHTHFAVSPPFDPRAFASLIYLTKGRKATPPPVVTGPRPRVPPPPLLTGKPGAQTAWRAVIDWLKTGQPHAAQHVSDVADSLRAAVK